MAFEVSFPIFLTGKHFLFVYILFFFTFFLTCCSMLGANIFCLFSYYLIHSHFSLFLLRFCFISPLVVVILYYIFYHFWYNIFSIFSSSSLFIIFYQLYCSLAPLWLFSRCLRLIVHIFKSDFLICPNLHFTVYSKVPQDCLVVIIILYL